MKRLWTPGVLSLFAVAAVGCGSPNELRPPNIARALVKLSFPEQVVAVPSTDSQYAMEASVAMVASESAGVKAYINAMGVEVTDEATGTNSRAHFVLAGSVEAIPAGGSVGIPFRVYLSSTGTYRVKVTLDTSDAGPPSGTGNAGSFTLWDDARSGEQARRFARFMDAAPRGTCVIECGAGMAIPTVRFTSERAAARLGGTLVRINVREPDTPPGHVGLPMAALEALTRIEALLAS